ncbi:hypothetical protein Q8G37_15950 [Bacillus wiedmannii]|uniref:hypothetical protein n=1 Tax=Bacillus wiedmannii TaxID=1890302 RepID=UPI0027309EA8|nr:hypothetical protein [Bacillus wiedmannii]MDP1457939.1 hypothetical protein [Bacillus wiedmannii]
MAEITKIESKDGNIYEVGGKKYRELDKVPDCGDKILVVDGSPSGSKTYKNGDVLTVLRHDSDGDVYIQEPDANEDILWSTEFVVVELIETEIEQLSRKVTRLEERVNENHRNILTFSQMAESARSDASKAIGGVNALDEQLDLVREDIVFLDEKVSALEETKPPQNITININVLDIESAKAIVESFTKGRE